MTERGRTGRQRAEVRDGGVRLTLRDWRLLSPHFWLLLGVRLRKIFFGERAGENLNYILPDDPQTMS